MSEGQQFPDPILVEATPANRGRPFWRVVAVLGLCIATAGVVAVVARIRHLLPIASFDVALPEIEGLSISFSRDAETVAVSVEFLNGPVVFFDVASGEERSRWERPRLTRHFAPFDSSGEWLVTTMGKSGSEYQIREINPADGTETVVFRRPWSEFTLKNSQFDEELYVGTPVGLSPDGESWFHARPGIGIEVWNVAEGVRRHTLAFDDVTNLAFSPDSKTVAAFNAQGEVRVWDVRSGEERSRFSGLSDFRYSKFDLDDSGVALLDDAQQLDVGNYASRAILGPESDRVVQIPDRRVLRRFPNGDVLLTHEPFQQKVHPSLAIDRHDPPLPRGALVLQDRFENALWRRQLDVREIKPIQLTPFHLLAWTGENRVTAINLKTGKNDWSHHVPADSRGFSRHSFAVSTDGRFVAYGYAHGPRQIAHVKIWRL